MKKLIIFDLDGTLLNTIEDLHNALNYTLGKYGLKKVSLDDTKKMVGNGIRNLIIKASNSDNRIDEMYKTFIDFYSDNYAVYTKPYDYLEDELNRLKNKGYIMGVVSNKNYKISEKLIKLFFPNIFDFIIGDGMGFKRKPDPEIFNYLISKHSLSKDDVILVGDGDADVLSIKNSGIKGLILSYGFRTEEELKKIWDGPIIDSPKLIYDYIEKII